MVTKVGSVPNDLLHTSQIWFPAGWNLTCSGDPGPCPAGGGLPWVSCVISERSGSGSAVWLLVKVPVVMLLGI